MNARIFVGAPRMVLAKVSPEQAQAWLSSGGARLQRKHSQRRVAKYADMMRTGRWQLNGVPISITSDGHVVNGQHRLRAIVEFGQPVTFWVEQNVNPETFKTHDTGVAVRSATDRAARP